MNPKGQEEVRVSIHNSKISLYTDMYLFICGPQEQDLGEGENLEGGNIKCSRGKVGWINPPIIYGATTHDQLAPRYFESNHWTPWALWSNSR